ncbi:MAG: PorT family protein [Bacteroidetes bacterium CHB5]|nr:PorT family protein [Bacteroidetes bacterium CHB5]
MKKLTDEELDLIFKNAAEGNTPPYDAAAWDALAQKLDAPPPVPFWKKWLPFILVGTVVFLTGIWVGRTGSNEIQSNFKNTDQSLAGDIGTKPLNHELKEAEKSNDVTTALVQPEKETINQQVDQTIIHNQYLPQKKQPSTIAVKPSEMDKSTGALDEFVEPQVDPFSNQEQKIVIESILNTDVNTDSSVYKPEVTKDSTEISKEPEDKPGRERVYGLFIRLLASPDLSSIKFGPTELGSNFGLIGEFSFSENFSVSTGIIKALKNYESYQKEAYGNSARHLEGRCSILDVPLNFTYYFPSQRKFSGYVVAGASSYLMLRENYIYTIISSSGDSVYPSEAIRKNNEWFKVLNLAVGLQYQWAPRWQVQMEPYIKAPLADLGDRNVRLSSVGAFAGLRYKLNSN